MFLFLFPYVTFQTQYVRSLGYQSLYISGTETIQFDLSSSFTIVVAFSKSSSWRTTSGSQLQPVYKNPSSITISSSTDSYIYFTVFRISSSYCDYVDVIIDGPTSRSYKLTYSDLSSNNKYCLLFHYMNEMTYNLYRSSSTESYDKLYYSTSYAVTASMISVSSALQLSQIHSIAIQIYMDSSNIYRGTEMGVSSISGTNSYTGGFYSVPGYSAKFSSGSGTGSGSGSGSGSFTSSLADGKNSITISSTRQTYRVPSGYLLVFPDSNSYVYGLAEVYSESLSILGNTGIKSVYFKEAGTVTLYSNSGSRSIHVIMFYDYLTIGYCDEVIVANKVDFTVHTKQLITTCVYIAPVDGSITVGSDSQLNIYYANGNAVSYNRNLHSFSSEGTFYSPVQIKISDSTEKTQFEISDDSYYSYKLLIRDGTNTNKTYYISSSSSYNLNSNIPQESPSNGPLIAVIVGIVVGLLVIIAIIIVACCCCCHCCKSKSQVRQSSSSTSSSSSRRRSNAGGSSSPTPSGQPRPQQTAPPPNARLYPHPNVQQYPPPNAQQYPPPNAQQYPPPNSQQYPPPPTYATPNGGQPVANAPPTYATPYSSQPSPQYAPPPASVAPPVYQDQYANPYQQ